MTIKCIEIINNIYQQQYRQFLKRLMQLQKVKIAFQRKGYTPNAYIDKKQYFRLLNSLMIGGGQFYEEVADELWTQAAGQRPSKQLLVNQICETIYDAQNILKKRLKQTNQQIETLQKEKSRLQYNTSKQSQRRIQQIKGLLQQLYTERQSFEDDFRLVTQPFGINPVISFSQRKQKQFSIVGHPAQPAYLNQSPQQVYPSGEQINEALDLKAMLYLTLVYCFLEIIMIYDKYDFLNIMVVVCLLSLYLMNFFDKIYIRFTLGLDIISILLDFVWLIMYAGSKWSPSSVSNNSIYQLGYMRFIVFFTIILIPLKISLAFFLFKYRNTQSKEKYLISVGLMKIILNGNRSNPISKSLANHHLLSH